MTSSKLSLEDKELIEAIATRVTEKQSAEVKAFWIESERHYNDHIELRKVVTTYKTAQGYLWKIVLGLAVVGSTLTTALYAVYSLLTLKSST